MRYRKKMWVRGLALALFLLLTLQYGLVSFAADTPVDGESDTQSAVEEMPGEASSREETPGGNEDVSGDEDAPSEEESDSEDSSISQDPPPDTEEEPSFGIQATILDASAIIVYTFDELVTALSQDNGYTTIYIGADITGKSGGAVIHASKQNVVIDGCPPDSPSGTRYTYTDYDSTDWTNTIRITSSGVRSVVVQNLNVVARNYYGVICCQEVSNYTPTITYSNMTYSGPQAIFNRFGTNVIVDSSFTITKNGSSPSQEFAEVNRIEFAGNVAINSNSTGSAVLWMTYSTPGLVVRSGANVVVTTPNYFIYNDYNTAVSLENGASLSVTTNTYGFTNGDMKITSLSLAAGASLEMTQNTASIYGALRIEKSLTVAEGAYMEVQGKGTGAGIQFTSAGSTATFTNPARVRILTASNAAFGFTGGAASSLSILAGALNFWGTATTLSPAAAPGSIWNKNGDTLVDIKSSYNGNTISTLSSNLLITDPMSQLLTTTNFGVRSSQLVAFGACPLSVNRVTNKSTSIEGNSGAGAQLSAVYTSALGLQTATGYADVSGNFSLALAGGVPILLSTAKVTTHWNGLYSVQVAEVVDEGELTMRVVPATLDFGTVAISATDTLVHRQTSNFIISVNDTRLLKSPWALQVSVDGPLRATVNETVVTLPNALVFVAPNASRTPLEATPLTVHTQQQELLDGMVDVSWDDDEGILFLLPAGQGYAGTSYSATLHWYLVDAP